MRAGRGWGAGGAGGLHLGTLRLREPWACRVLWTQNLEPPHTLTPWNQAPVFRTGGPQTAPGLGAVRGSTGAAVPRRPPRTAIVPAGSAWPSRQPRGPGSLSRPPRGPALGCGSWQTPSAHALRAACGAGSPRRPLWATASRALPPCPAPVPGPQRAEPVPSLLLGQCRPGVPAGPGAPLRALAQGKGGRQLVQLGTRAPLCPRAVSLGLAEPLTPPTAPSPARALRCHVCSSASDCEKPQTCQLSSRYCKTEVKGA